VTALLILGTGSRHLGLHQWAKPDRALVDVTLMDCWHDAVQDGYDGIRLLQGEADGADTLMREWAVGCGVPVEGMAARWQECGTTCPEGHLITRRGRTWCPTAGFRRNQAMVDRQPGWVVAFLIAGMPCKGTRDCATRAVRAGIPVLTVEAAR
jgi:hypothetical protein